MKTLKNMDENELLEFMNTMCVGIELIAEHSHVEKPMFCIVLFNDPEVAQYGSNCERADIIKAMRETADRLERQEDVERKRTFKQE